MTNTELFPAQPEMLPEFDERTTLHTLCIEDAYKGKDGHYETVMAMMNARAAEGFYGNPAVDLSRERRSIDPLNPSTAWMREHVPGFADWHELVPTAAALAPLYNPLLEVLPNGKPLTPEMQAWMKNGDDAVGIRSRSEVVERVMSSGVLDAPHKQQRWISLGCGAAQSVIGSLQHIRNYEGIVPNVTLVDYQRQALSLANQSAAEAGFSEVVTPLRMNILKPEGIAVHEGEDGPAAETFDVVEAVGIVEYLKSEAAVYAYDQVIETRTNMVGITGFLRNAYELVKPGGMLVVGNMRDTHPQLGFTLNTIQWPHIQPRSVGQMAQLIRAAGIDGKLDIYCPDDTVYAIYVIHKD